MVWVGKDGAGVRTRVRVWQEARVLEEQCWIGCKSEISVRVLEWELKKVQRQVLR